MRSPSSTPCRAARAFTACWTPPERFSMSEKHATSRAEWARTSSQAMFSRRYRRWSRRPSTWKSPSRTRIPRRCCSNSISSRSTVRGSTSCCETTRVFPSCTSKPDMNFHGSAFIAARAKNPAVFLGHIRPPARYGKVCNNCRSYFGFATAMTPISPIVRGLVCNIKSSAARRRVSGSSAKRNMPATWVRRSKCWKGATTRFSWSSGGEWKPPLRS